MNRILSIALLVFISIPGHSQSVFKSREPKNPFTDMEQGPVPKWSPNGDKFAFITNTKNRSRVLIKTLDSCIYIEGAQNNFVWSNNGEAIIYTSKEKGRLLKVFRYNISSGTTFKISGESKWSEFYPSISPDDSTIAYYSQTNEPFQIYLASAGKSTKLVNDPSAEYLHPKWSPSGKFLLYFKHKQPNSPKIEIIDFKTRESIFAIDGSKYDFFDWSLTEDEILVYEYGERLVKLNLKNGQIKPLTGNFSHILSAEWSKSTDKIVFSANEEIYVVNSDGAGLKKIYSQGVFPSWHPLGNKIIFVKAEDGLPIYEIDSTGDNLRMLYDGKKTKQIKH